MKFKKNNSLLALAVQHVKSYLFKSKFNLNHISNSKVFDSYEFSIVKTEDEFRQAFCLVYESYIAKKITRPNAQKLHFSSFHFLPTTVTIILKHKHTKEVIATMSLINDSPLGLPSEELEDLSDIRKMGPVGEASSLCIKESARKLKGQILIPMIHCFFQIAQELFGLDYLVFSIHPKAKGFYSLMFSAHNISSKIQNLSLANNAPAISMVAPCSKVLLKKIWTNPLIPPISREMSQFLFSPSPLGSIINTQPPKYYSDYQSLHSTHILRNIFELFKKVNPDFPAEDQLKLTNVFFTKNHFKVFKSQVITKFSLRNDHRLLSKCKGQALKNGQKNSLYTLDVSLSGVRFVSQSEYSVGDHLTLALKISPSERSMIDVKILWTNESGQHGATIEIIATPNWFQFIENLTSTVEMSAKNDIEHNQAA